MRTSFLPFHTPCIEDDDIESVLATLKSHWLTTGPRVQEFEKAFAEYVGARHAIALNSGTAALHLALDAAGVGPGDEVLVPTLTFTATAEVVCYVGAKPVLVDSDPSTMNIDPARAESAITPRTRAIIPVHYGGLACDMDSILGLAKRHDLAVIEDAAHSLPARYRGKMIGTIGNFTCFSFYATKCVTTGEGGMLTTNDDEGAARIRTMSLHGISKDAWKRYTAEGSWFYEVQHAGYKYNMTDMAAALGVTQLRKCDRLTQLRAGIASRYDAAFAGMPEIQLPPRMPHAEHAWHLYAIQLQTDRLSITRSRFIEELKNRKIGASVHFIPLHLHPFYRDTFGYRPGDFVEATAIYERLVSLPIFPSMSEYDIKDVINAVVDIVHRFRR